VKDWFFENDSLGLVYSRDKVRVLMRPDPCKLDLKNPKVHRQDHDFAVT
jgi:hypothetical protein